MPLTKNTVVVEMTGIFRAGYLPGLFKPIKILLEDRYLRIASDGRAKEIELRYVVDNTLMSRNHPDERMRINELLERKRTAGLTETEWNSLMRSLKLADELCITNLNSNRKDIDIVLRRGGSLQNALLIGGNRWEQSIVERSLYADYHIFLRAESVAIEQTFQNNDEARIEYEREPRNYNPTARDALKEQDEWYETVVKPLKLIEIIRTRPTNENSAKDEFAQVIVEYLSECLEPKFRTQPRISVFISYSHKDAAFAIKLADALKSRGVNVWIDKNVLPGSYLHKEIATAVSRSDSVIVILSTNAIESNWVSSYEVGLALSQQLKASTIKVVPLLIEKDLQLPEEFRAVKCQDFWNQEDFEQNVDILMQRLRLKR